MEETEELSDATADPTSADPKSAKIIGTRRQTEISNLTSTNGYNREARHKSGRCPECGKLMRLSELEKHAKSHLEERKYACPDCPKTFAERASLGRHKLVHSRDDKKKIRGVVAVKVQKKTHGKKQMELPVVKVSLISEI